MHLERVYPAPEIVGGTAAGFTEIAVSQEENVLSLIR